MGLNDNDKYDEGFLGPGLFTDSQKINSQIVNNFSGWPRVAQGGCVPVSVLYKTSSKAEYSRFFI